MEKYGVDVFGSVYGPLTDWLENVNEILDWKKSRGTSADFEHMLHFQ